MYSAQNIITFFFLTQVICKPNHLFPTYDYSVANNLVNCTKQIILKYIPNDIFILLVDGSVRQYGHNTEISLFKKYEHVTSLVYTYNGTQIVVATTLFRIRQIVVFIDNANHMKTLIDDMASSKFYFNNKFIVIYTELADENHHQVAEKLIDACWQHLIIDVVMLVPSKDLIRIYGYKPFNANLCENTRPIVLDSWSVLHGFRKKANLFPARLKNLHGCVINVVTFPLRPLIVIEQGEDGNKLEGLEGELLKLLSEKMNFTYSLLLFNGIDKWGGQLDNGSWTGALGLISTNKAHFAIGGFMVQKERMEYFEKTKSHYSSSLVWAVSRGRQFPAWMKLWHPFDEPVWIVIWSIFNVAMMTIFIVSKYKQPVQDFVFGISNRMPVFNIFTIGYGWTLSYDPKGTFARYLLMVWVMYTFLLRASYQSSLVFFLTNFNYDKHVDTVQEMLDLDYTFNTAETDQEIIVLFPELKDRIVAYNATTLKQKYMEMGRTFTRFASLEIKECLDDFNVRYSKKPEEGQGVVFTASERILTSSLTIYLRKSSPLKKPFNTLISRAIQGGLLERIRLWYYKSEKWWRHEMEEKFKYPIPLSLFHLKIAYQMWACGIVVSVIAFMKEMISYVCDRYKHADIT